MTNNSLKFNKSLTNNIIFERDKIHKEILNLFNELHSARILANSAGLFELLDIAADIDKKNRELKDKINFNLRMQSI